MSYTKSTGCNRMTEKNMSLFLSLESNVLAKTGDMFFFWLGHFDIKFPKYSINFHKLSIFVAFGGETPWKYAKYNKYWWLLKGSILFWISLQWKLGSLGNFPFKAPYDSNKLPQ